MQELQRGFVASVFWFLNIMSAWSAVGHSIHSAHYNRSSY